MKQYQAMLSFRENKESRKPVYIQLLMLIAVPFLLFGTITVVTAQTYPPSCVVTSPHSNSYFQENSDVVIRAYSTDKGKTQQNGTVSKVEFFVDGNKIGESSIHSNNTYSFTWNCAQVGEYRITAKATNNKGVSFTSVGQFVTVGSAEVPPTGMSANKGKYLANIIPGAPQTKYNEYWNGVTAENSCKWESVERSRDVFNWRGADVSYNHAKNNNLMFRYHALVWGNQTPAWLEGIQNNVPEFRAELEEYIQAVAERYKYMDQVDVLNEQIGTHAPHTQWFRNGLGGGGATGYDWAIYLFERARELLPNTKLVINDYGLVQSYTNINAQLELMSHLRDRGLIDGFGTQSHDFSVDGASAAGLKSNLDQMANGGVPIFVTELDLRGGVDSDNNDAQQLQSYQTHFPVYWEHPHVAGVTLWGYITGATWRTGTGLMSSSGVEKSALKWLKQYISGQENVGYPFNTIPGSCCETPPPVAEKTLYKYVIGETAVQLSASGTGLTWYSPDGTSSSTAPVPATDVLGTYTYAVTQMGSCESSRTNITVVVYQPQGPYGGVAHAVPGKIEFEDYDIGGQDSAYFDVDAGTNVDPAPDYRTDEDVDLEECTDVGGGYNLGWTTAGEWLEYTVDVASAGLYSIDIRVACNGDGRTISLSSNGNSLVADIAVPNTGGWQAWETITVNDIELSKGLQVIRLTIGSEDYVNLNYMTFVSDAPLPVVEITAPANSSEFTANQTVTISADAEATDASVAEVKFYANDELLSTDENSPYSFEWSGMAPGTYEIKATVTDSNGASASDAVSVVVGEAPAIVSLRAGWNLIGCPLEGNTPLETALQSIWGEVEVVKDFDGFWDVANEPALNSLDSLGWGKGYFVKVKQACELRW